MGYRGDERTLLLSDLKYFHHEWHIVVLFEPFAHVFPENRGRKRPKALAALDLSIENIFHVCATRIADDRAVAQRARPPFHSSLKPADDEAFGNCFHGTHAQFSLVR